MSIHLGFTEKDRGCQGKIFEVKDRCKNKNNIQNQCVTFLKKIGMPFEHCLV